MCDFSEYRGPSSEWLAVEATLPVPPELSQAELLATTNRGREDVARKEMELLSPKVSLLDHSIPTRDGQILQARSYRPSSVEPSQTLPLYVHFHGGGFFFGTLSSEDATCSRIAIDVEVVVVNVNYRHSPDFLYPTPWNDTEDAMKWIYEHAGEFGGDHQRIVVGGVSAGGCLAAALVQTLKRQQSHVLDSIKGQVLMIPVMAHEDCYEPLLRQIKDPQLSSYKENEFAPILPLSRMRMFNSLLYRESPDPSDRRANPGLASADEVAALPPATFGVAGLDPLRDEALLYAKVLHEAGVPTDVNVFTGVPHGFRRFGARLSASRAWDEVMHEGIRWALNGPLLASTQEIHVY